MESINKIKVFVSSKCDDQNTGHKYSDVRNGIKERLESTGLAEVYVFEEESASTLSAEQHYSFALEDSDVCIFLIDNMDGIPSGVQREIDVVQKYGIKALYYFCDENSKEKTEFEKSILTADNAKSKTIHSFSELCNESSQGLMDDITRIYHYYCKGKLNVVGDTGDQKATDHQLVVDSIDDVSFPKEIIDCIGSTTDYLYRLIMRNKQNKVDPSSEIDECARLFLEVVLGDRSINEFNVGVFLGRVKSHQTEPLSIAVETRWKAVQEFYKGNIDACLVELNSALIYSRDNSMPRWFINDLLIDIRNIHNISCIISNHYTASSAQEELDAISESLYYPIIDRINETLQGKYNQGLYKETIKSPYTVSFGNNIQELSSLFATAFIVAMFFGSLTHIRLIKEKLKALFFYLTNIYDDWIFKYNLFKYAICEGDNKEIRELRSTYPEILNRLTSDEADEIVEFCNRDPIEYVRVTTRLRAFSYVGYYLDNESFEKHYRAVESDLRIWVTSDNHIFEVGRKLFDSLAEVAYRLSQVKMASFCSEIMDAGWSAYYHDMFKFIGDYISLNDLPVDVADKLVNQIVGVAEDEKTCGLMPISTFINLRRQESAVSITIDECVKKHYPTWYETYSLETTDDEHILNDYYRITIDRIKQSLKNSATRGVHTESGNRYIYNLYLMLKNSESKIDVKLLFASTDLMIDVLSDVRCSITSKMDALLFLCYVKINYPSIEEQINDSLSKVSSNEESVLNVDFDVFSANIDLLALKCAMKMLGIFTDRRDYAGLVELFALAKSNVPTVLSVSRFVVDMLVGEYKGKLGNDVEWLLLINSLEWMHINNNEARANATRVLLALAYNDDNHDIINRTLLNIVKTENVYLKNLILRKMSLVEGISTETQSIITETCLQDSHYDTREIASGRI